jgi:hypothetical protein
MVASLRFRVTEVDALSGSVMDGDPLTLVQTFEPGME